jgi:outer membrane immunogenic protein
MTIETKNVVLGVVAGAAAVVSGAAAASAADAGAVDDWSGFYVGGSVGMLGGYAPFLDGEGYELSNDATLGGFVGYNVDMGSWVLGAEVAYQGSTDFDYSTDYQINKIADLKIRAGLKLSENMLAYGFGGLSGGDATNYDASEDYSFWGANFGVGIDFMVIDRVTVGAEITGRYLEAYDWSADGNQSSGLTTQASLRAAFHF